MVAATEQIGKFDLSTAESESTPEVQSRWGKRQGALAAWLFAQWDLEREGEPVAAVAERN